MDLKNLPQSKTVRGVIIGIAIVILILIIFQTGVAVGYRKAVFSARFGDNYSRLFGPSGPMMSGYPGRPPRGPQEHGATGKIISINLPTIVVAGPGNLEQIITTGSSTLIKSGREDVSIDKLKVGAEVIIFGQPNNDGQIEAKLIRLSN